MTAGARRVGRTKTAADVASLASYIRVRAVEHEPGTEMIEGLLRPGVVRGKQTGCHSAYEDHAP